MFAFLLKRRGGSLGFFNGDRQVPNFEASALLSALQNRLIRRSSASTFTAIQKIYRSAKWLSTERYRRYRAVVTASIGS